MTKAELKESPTLADIQAYIKAKATERGFEDETFQEIFLMFIEECGEMAKAARKREGIKMGQHSREHSLEHEVADVFLLLLSMCNASGIDLEQAFRSKEVTHEKHYG